ncbi:MAG: hypothetical protein ACJAYU_003636 [Bradymonadia bacterium]|jgi:uncharacterized protein YbcC (UPF0753/DUF2309 family)
MNAQLNYELADAMKCDTSELIVDACAAAGRACERVAPLWPLRNMVAVNPFLGMASLDFAEAQAVVAQTSGARMTMPRAFYARAISEGEIVDADIADAVGTLDKKVPVATTVADIYNAALREQLAHKRLVVPTIADVVSRDGEHDWAGGVVDRISRWAASYYDDRSAAWSAPFRRSEPWRAWRDEAAIDRSPEFAGLKGFRAFAGQLPDTADAALEVFAERLGLSGAELELYFHRALATISGWAGAARHRHWEAALRGGADDAARALLAIRVAWDIALLDRGGDALRKQWRSELCERAPTTRSPGHAELLVDLVLQVAYERSWQRRFVSLLDAPTVSVRSSRPDAQMVFCIDTRSEVFRRKLESKNEGVDTLGFAGFFGASLELVPADAASGGAHCPAFLAPSIRVREQAITGESDTLTLKRRERRRLASAWRAFKLSAISSFSFVEATGLGYSAKLVSDTFGLGSSSGASERVRKATTSRPSLDHKGIGESATGLRLDERLDLASGFLKGTSLHGHLARVVVLCGHGATTRNNPHASALQCGACGGHAGDANARVVAAVLNDPAVRAELAEADLIIPDDTVFVAALHDTTTDEVTLFDEALIPETHRAELNTLRSALASAGDATRAERGERMGVRGPSADNQVRARSRDWAQVRPEYGLAGCGAFVVAPRERTRALNLGANSFLHSYDWRRDEGFAVLETVLTAPMVVAQWINLQYYASTVDNRVYGAGDKTLHNAVGTIGVLEGAGGDIRVGLPLQSLHDGNDWVHVPVRLSVFVEAPLDAIDAILRRHPHVRELLDNNWLYLFAIDDSGAVAHKYAGDLKWSPAQLGGRS